MKFTPNLTRTERQRGLVALIVAMFLLPALLMLALPDLSAAMVNFTTYFVAAAAAIYFLHGFLGRNLKAALERPFLTIYYAALGYLAQLALGEIVTLITFLADPGFVNQNNRNIAAQLNAELGLMILTILVLAPIVEECLFRGLLFRGLYDHSPAAAWVLSAGLFAAGHVVGYIGSCTPMELLLSFIQYLPAGIALCIAYRRGGSIFSPILTHAIVNAVAVYDTLR